MDSCRERVDLVFASCDTFLSRECLHSLTAVTLNPSSPQISVTATSACVQFDCYYCKPSITADKRDCDYRPVVVLVTRSDGMAATANPVGRSNVRLFREERTITFSLDDLDVSA